MKTSDFDLIEELIAAKARNSFWIFYQAIYKKLKVGWFQKEVIHALEGFYNDFLRGMKPKLAIEAPPQHGKSQMIVAFIAWVSGKNPDLRSIYTSFSSALGERANAHLQRIIESKRYQKIFPMTHTSVTKKEGGSYKKNSSLIEYVGKDGYFRNTTVMGSITGEGLDIGVIDDPIKGKKASGSELIRNDAWEWFSVDFFTRFSEDAGFLVICTRWHIDDPLGRMIKKFGSKIKVLSYPAIATKKEKNRKKGEALFPKLKSRAFLEERKSILSNAMWEALYQCNPIIVGGEIIKTRWFGFYDKLPILKSRAIFADTAQKTKQANDFSVFECWGEGEDGKIYLLDLVRGKWEAPELKKIALSFWNKHAQKSDVTTIGSLRKMVVEDKSSGTGLIQDIQRSYQIPIYAVQRVKDKYSRLSDVLSYIECGFIFLPESADFLSDFLKECEEFTADDSHMHDDQIDPMIDAINDLLVNNSTKVWENII